MTRSPAVKPCSWLREDAAQPTTPAPTATATTEDPAHLEDADADGVPLLEAPERRGAEVDMDCLADTDRATALPERKSGRAQLLADIVPGKIFCVN